MLDLPQQAMQEKDERGAGAFFSSPIEQAGEYLPIAGNTIAAAPIGRQAGGEPENTSRHIEWPEIGTRSPQAGWQEGAMAQAPLPDSALHINANAQQPISHLPWPEARVLPSSSPGREVDRLGQRSSEEIEWPSLPDENLSNGQPWRAAYQAWARQQRLDDEQRGKIWSA